MSISCSSLKGIVFNSQRFPEAPPKTRDCQLASVLLHNALRQVCSGRVLTIRSLFYTLILLKKILTDWHFPPILCLLQTQKRRRWAGSNSSLFLYLQFLLVLLSILPQRDTFWALKAKNTNFLF